MMQGMDSPAAAWEIINHDEDITDQPKFSYVYDPFFIPLFDHVIIIFEIILTHMIYLICNGAHFGFYS